MSFSQKYLRAHPYIYSIVLMSVAACALTEHQQYIQALLSLNFVITMVSFSQCQNNFHRFGILIFAAITFHEFTEFYSDPLVFVSEIKKTPVAPFIEAFLSGLSLYHLNLVSESINNKQKAKNVKTR